MEVPSHEGYRLSLSVPLPVRGTATSVPRSEASSNGEGVMPVGMLVDETVVSVNGAGGGMDVPENRGHGGTCGSSDAAVGTSDASPDEVHELVSEYSSQLQDIESALETDPTNVELQQVRDELRSTLQEARSSLEEIEGCGEYALEQAAAAMGAVASEPRDPTEHHWPSLKRDRQGVQKQNAASNNPRIHPASKYAAAEPDFKQLAENYPELRPFVRVAAGSGRGSIDFTDAAAARMLTKVLLKHDFGVEWWVPDGQLVPPVVNRLNYIHWVADLLELSSPPMAEGGGTAEAAMGLDIGCGANLIYPLLGAAEYGWRWVATDITDVAIASAISNCDRNPHLAGLIHVRRVPAVGPEPGSEGEAGAGGIVTAAVAEGERFHFCLCNPPFFSSMAEAGRSPHSSCWGTRQEMVFPGGEMAFLQRMVEDSRKLRGRVWWYSSMVGRKTTLKKLRQLLHGCNVPVLRTTELAQGRTMRWAIAWSWAAPAASMSTPLRRRAAAAEAHIGPQLPPKAPRYQAG